ncbi:hypothetical protein KO493_00675 [Tamlana agarivorans]|uniref:Uncharacterized protein n=1 Tax=Pseudotamlana agarivorans TaxID=481183 RepID=A0ACC5U4I1_9FLAO|nr:hypothetical protein [Tamlana agarivorans]MBU2949213.1 hypothetical protein [Tamlana agarivorans]
MLAPHIALYVSNKEDKGQVIESIQNGDLDINFSKLNGALFSEITLNKFIQEEVRHEQFDVETIHKNSLK